MDPRPVSTAGAYGTSWKLRPDVAEQTQGLVVTGFGFLPRGRTLFLEFPAGAGPFGGAWLTSLAKVAPITPATPPAGPAPETAAALALTWTGFERLGLTETALASFSRPFREGMLQEDRLRRLGDRRKGEWQETVIPGGLTWSANTPGRRKVTVEQAAFDVLPEKAETPPTTAITVHAALFLYVGGGTDLAAHVADVRDNLAASGVKVVHELDLFVDVNDTGISNEHFGFADGLSQPEPWDGGGAVMLDGAARTEPDEVQGVPLGEILIGYSNGHHEIATGPVVPSLRNAAFLGKTDVPDPEGTGLVEHPEAQGFYDFGRNGTYVVIRELKQDVATFWHSMDENATRIRERDPETSAHVSAEWLAARVIGRDRDGHLLRPEGVLPPVSGAPDNGFLFFDADRYGVGCPLGSHVRRANPRDSLAPNPGQKESLLQAANNHRILRRGRKYGPRIADPRQDDGQDRGLLFVCLNTDIARQFEFVQQTWLLNKDFATLSDEVDPLVGPDGAMTIRDAPLRRRVHVRTFVNVVGGDYFFLPSLPALRYLERLG